MSSGKNFSDIGFSSFLSLKGLAFSILLGVIANKESVLFGYAAKVATQRYF